MEKRAFVAIALSTLVFVVYQYFIIQKYPPVKKPAESVQVKKVDAGTTPAPEKYIEKKGNW